MSPFTIRSLGALLVAASATALATTLPNTERPAHGAAAPEKGVAAANELSAAFRSASRIAAPSVVTVTSIRSSRTPTVHGFGRPSPGWTPFSSPFGQQNDAMPEQRGTGTGFAYDSHGTVVTNAHVVRGANQLRVQFKDGRDLDARVVGVDDASDIAVLEVDADTTPLRIGNSDALEVGDWVIAVGSPLGLNQTVTAGIVSAKGRSNVGLATYEDFIQTDAAINPGNSGGPLLNLLGEVVGINTAIASNNGGNVGIGFSIPMHMARSVIDALRSDGRVQRGRIGVMIQELTPYLARSFGYEGAGVLVGDVIAGSPAAKSGMLPGDIIRSYDALPMSDPSALKNAVAATRPGSEVPLEVFRDGHDQTLNVVIDELEADASVDAPEGRAKTLGLELAPITREMQDRTDGLPDGVLVRNVVPNTPAARAGLQAGDVIVAVGGQPVADESGLRKSLDKSDLTRGVRLQVWSEGTFRFAVLRS